MVTSHLQHEDERPNTEGKYMDSDKVQWRDPEFETLINEVGGDTNMQSKQTHALQYKS